MGRRHEALVRWASTRRGAWALVIAGAAVSVVSLPWFVSTLGVVHFHPWFRVSAICLGLGLGLFGSGIYYLVRIRVRRASPGRNAGIDAEQDVKLTAFPVYKTRFWALFTAIGGALLGLIWLFVLVIELIAYGFGAIFGSLPLIFIGAFAFAFGMKSLRAQRDRSKPAAKLE